jgi:hypothetical protein
MSGSAASSAMNLFHSILWGIAGVIGSIIVFFFFILLGSHLVSYIIPGVDEFVENALIGSVRGTARVMGATVSSADETMQKAKSTRSWKEHKEQRQRQRRGDVEQR